MAMQDRKIKEAQRKAEEMGINIIEYNFIQGSIRKVKMLDNKIEEAKQEIKRLEQLITMYETEKTEATQEIENIRNRGK